MKTNAPPSQNAGFLPETASYEKVTFLQRLGLGFGGIPDLGLQYAIMTMANPIFNVAMGVNPVLIGIAMSLPRFWEMIIDPWIGAVSDRTRSPLGRRHPYILWGGILGGLIFAAVWWVPQNWSIELKGAWLIVMALLQFTAFSFFMVPYSALLAEVSHNPLERTRIMAMRTAIGAASSCGISWLYWLCQRPWFNGPVEGMQVIGILFGGCMAAAAILPTLVCRKSRLYQPSAQQMKDARESVVIREILKIREFRYIILAVFSLLASFTLVSNLGFYISIYFMFGGDTKEAAVLQGISSVVICVTSIGTCTIVGFLSKKIGRIMTLKLFMLLALAGKISIWWTYRPEWPYATIISGVLVNMGVTTFWIMMPSMLGEISNLHEKQTGRSLYGSFCALYGVTMKIAASISLLLTGFVLNFTKFDVALGARQSVETITQMRLFSVFVPVSGLLLAMWFLRYIWPKAEKPTVAA